MQKTTLEISWNSLWRIFFFVALVALMFYGRNILLGLFLAIVISSGLEVAVTFLERRGLPRTLGVLLIFLIGVLGIISIVYTIIPVLVVDVNTIFLELRKAAVGSWWGPLVNIKATQSFTDFLNKLSSDFFSGSASPFEAFSQILGGVGLALTVLISSIYLSLSPHGVENFIKAVFPPDGEEAALRVYARAERKMGYWFRTQIILTLTMGILTWLSLLILGVRHPFLIGVLAGIFELGPFVGPILAGAIAVMNALLTSQTLAIYTLVVFLLLHQLESHVLVPLLTGRSVGLHPVIVIVSLLIGVEVGGFLGILISVPAAALFQEIIEEWAGKRKLAET